MILTIAETHTAVWEPSAECFHCFRSEHRPQKLDSVAFMRSFSSFLDQFFTGFLSFVVERCRCAGVHRSISAFLSPVESTVDPTAESVCVLITVVVIVTGSPCLQLPASECERTTRQNQRKVLGFRFGACWHAYSISRCC